MKKNLKFWIRLLLIINPLALIFSQASGQEMFFEIEYRNQTNIIYASGDITSDTPQKFEKFLDNSVLDGFRFVVALDSDGGDLIGGLALGTLIRQSGFIETSVEARQGPARCLSACALAFLGGQIRTVPNDAQLGFHQFYSSATGLDTYKNLIDELNFVQAKSQILSAITLKYFMDMGVQPDLFLKAATTLPSEMYIPEPYELIEFKIVTTKDFNHFEIEPYKNGIITFSKNELNASGSNIVAQITFLCEKQGNRILLLSTNNKKDAYTADEIAKLKNKKKTFEIHVANKTYTIPHQNLRFYEGSTSLLAIYLSNEIAQLISRNDFSGTWSHGRTIDDFFSDHEWKFLYFSATPDLQSQEMIGAAFRHCYR